MIYNFADGSLVFFMMTQQQQELPEDGYVSTYKKALNI
jgi:hypothetical protein